MKFKLLIITIAIVILPGCAQVSIVDSGNGNNGVVTATNANDVFVYRSRKPNWEYSEIGLISVKGMSDIEGMYKAIREESSQKGAHGVIDFDIDSEEIVTTSTSTSCTPEGACSTITTSTTSIVYTASGTLIVRK